MTRRNCSRRLPALSYSQTRARPNILYIMSDDHAAHAISAYGSKINKTPNIDRIAKEGMRFDNCFVTNSICTPSRAAILTGQYSHINGVTRGRPLRPARSQRRQVSAERPATRPAMIGKWHLGSDPTGFDYWNILPGQGALPRPGLHRDDGNARSTRATAPT